MSFGPPCIQAIPKTLENSITWCILKNCLVPLKNLTPWPICTYLSQMFAWGKPLYVPWKKLR